MRLRDKICDQRMPAFPVLHRSNQSRYKLFKAANVDSPFTRASRVGSRFQIWTRHPSAVHRSLKEEEGAAEAAYLTFGMLPSFG